MEEPRDAPVPTVEPPGDAGPGADAAANAAASAAPERATWRRHVALFGVGAALIALDLWSKSAVFGALDPVLNPDAATDYGTSERNHPRISVLGGWLGFMLNLNYGAAFGQGSGSQGILVGGRILAALFLAFLIVRTPKGQPVQLAALVLVLAGALGNLYDNLCFEPHAGLPGYVEGRSYGPVRDFIDVYFAAWDWHFWTFNVADSCISVGAVLLIAAGLFGGGSRPAPA